MNYKDQSFEINENQIKFKNNTFFIYVIIFFSIGTFSFFSHWFAIIGLCIGFAIAFGIFIPLYWKNTIDISEISKVKIGVWDSSIDKDKNFWGAPKYKYHFPTGFDKKTTPQVIFVQRRNKTLAVGFVPDNCNKVISILQDRGISIIKETSR
jgi:hypothetical protein